MNLETLYILFKAETGDLKKGLGEAQKEITKLQDSIKRTDQATKGIGSAFLKTTESAVNFLAASTAAVYTLSHFKTALDFGVQLSQTSKILGVNTADLNAWGNAVELAGGDAKQFQNTLSSLAAKWGASPNNVLKALPLYGNLFSRLSPSRAQQVGAQLGLDQGTILLLQQGRREIEDVIKRQKELGVVTDQDAEQFRHYRESVTEANQASQVFFNHLAVDAIPLLIKLEKLSTTAFQYADKHREAFGGLGAAITAGLGAFTVRKLVTSSAGRIGIIGALGALAYEDYAKFSKGGATTALGYVTGVGAGGKEQYKKEVTNALSDIDKLPWYQRIFRLNQAVFPHNFPSNQLPNVPTNASPQVTYNLGPTTINTQATNGEDLLADLQNYTNGQFAQATNHFITPITA